MSVAPVQGNAASMASSASQVFSPFSANIVAGNSIELAIRLANTTSLITGVTDNLGNTYTADIPLTDAPASCSVAKYHCKVATGGACTITLALDTATAGRYAVEEYSGESANVDGTPSVGSGSGFNYNSGNLTTSVAGSALFGVSGSDWGSVETMGGTGTWVQRQASSGYVVLADQLGVSAGTYSYQPSETALSNAWVAGIAAYQQYVNQVAVPISDISAGSWTSSAGGSLYAAIDETTADDSDYDSTTATTSDAMEVRLTSLSTPESGSTTVKYRYKTA